MDVGRGGRRGGQLLVSLNTVEQCCLQHLESPLAVKGSKPSRLDNELIDGRTPSKGLTLVLR